jgi:hypothetical protein
MDAVSTCLALVPVPGLNVAFNLLRSIWNGVQQSKASQEKLKVLSTCIAQLLGELNNNFMTRRLSERDCERGLVELVE